MNKKGKIETEDYKVRKNKKWIKKKIPISDIWCIAPKNELRILQHIEDKATHRLGSCVVIRNGRKIKYEEDKIITKNIFVGIQTSGDSAYIVIPKIGYVSEKTLRKTKVLTVTPKGDPNIEFEIETDLLKYS